MKEQYIRRSSIRKLNSDLQILVSDYLPKYQTMWNEKGSKYRESFMIAIIMTVFCGKMKDKMIEQADLLQKEEYQNYAKY